MKMMLRLSSTITSAQELQALARADYASAGKSQIVEKISKFMKAHTIGVLNLLKDSGGLIQVVEATLELDEELELMATEPPEFVSSVLVANAGMFSDWAREDCAFLRAELGTRLPPTQVMRTPH